ncbi:nucleotide exchange factor GrpE [Leptospira mtsangambouensis]|uniref:Protein GrpE n=1 Tax=Leptospira mtsangambouensis TaxID=2484912 RepID=A0ABY2NVG6_9LEPT|nr:nucleotide exchange factor GrpE [Leptospira mtsangambouensis]TGM72422.1 nucleotide exchange factor GrpE [Leptospira mtsangambouensis]
MAEETNGSVDEQNVSVEEGQAITDEAIEQAVEGAEKELDNAKKEIETLKDSWLRERAEFQNYKRRTANDLLNARKESIKKFAEGLTGALDNLERVSNVPNQTPEVVAFVEGIKMVQKEFYSVLEKEGIKRLDPKGMPFDPMLMEAIASEESAEFSEETVVETYQAGYYHEEGENKQSIRPARVKVGKPQS